MCIILAYQFNTLFLKITVESIYLTEWLETVYHICYVYIFSLLHTFNYGVVLNHLVNPERDIASMLLYFSTIYFFIKIFEKSNNRDDRENIINIFLISFFVCVTTRAATIPLIVLLFYFFYKEKKYKLINFLNIFI